jgi:hypothetical protein
MLIERNYYDRYSRFNIDGVSKLTPFIKLKKKSTDKFTEFTQNSRLDIISEDYYGKPYYGFLILLANPQYGSLEYYIPFGEQIRIPFPLEETLIDFKEKLDNYFTYYDY